jgi:hypothetical protein
MQAYFSDGSRSYEQLHKKMTKIARIRLAFSNEDAYNKNELAGLKMYARDEISP